MPADYRNSRTERLQPEHSVNGGALLPHDALIPLIILVAALAAYLPGIGGNFLINWDDNKYIVENAAAHGFSIANLKSAFTNIYVGNYAPLHIVSYMADYAVWGLKPQGYRLVNILLHAANGTLLYHLLRKMTWRKIPALLAALFFVLHPVQVESVTWISQRKTVLAMFFSLASFLLYIRAADSCRSGYLRFIPSLVTLVLALLTKPVAVFLPPLYLAYEVIMKKNRDWPDLIRKISPFLLLSFAFCLLTMTTQHEGRTGWHGGTPMATFCTMLPIFMHYLGMLIFPASLSALYDTPIHHSLFEPVVAGSLFALMAILGGAVILSRRRPDGLFWFWFAILAFIPVSQIVPLTTLMNDRYLYFPLAGVSALVFGILSPLINSGEPRGRMVICISVVVLVLLAIASGRRTLVWKDELSLWTDSVQKAPGNRFARQGLAEALESRGDLAGAAVQYMEALRRDPGSPELNSQSGVVLAQLKDFPRAIPLMRTAVRLSPANAGYRMNLVGALLESRDYHEAIVEMKILDGYSSPTTRNSCMLGALYEKIGDNTTASVYYSKAMQINGGKPSEECSAIRGILELR